MFPRTLPIISLVLSAALLGACETSPSAPPVANLNPDSRAQISIATHQFSNAIRTGDADRLRAATIVADKSADTQRLSAEVIADTVSARQVITELSNKFNYVETQPSVLASDAWLNQLESAGDSATIYRAGPQRVGFKIDEQTAVYLRHINGQWKVELIPTLVDEANGMPAVHDPVVAYRVGVSRAANEFMLSRLATDEFRSKADFDDARSIFWMQYLTIVASDKDPHYGLLSTLPIMPAEDTQTSSDR